MGTNRREMTVRLVSLHSPQANDARVGGTVAERIALMVRLTDMLWRQTGRPLPSYTRSTMPIVLKPFLHEPENR